MFDFVYIQINTDKTLSYHDNKTCLENIINFMLIKNICNKPFDLLLLLSFCLVLRRINTVKVVRRLSRFTGGERPQVTIRVLLG